MSDLYRLSAIEALRLFASRDLSPVELMRATIARAEAVEPRINAFTYTMFDEAMATAKEAESRYMRGDARPLEGLPIAIKDAGHIAGQPTSGGSLTADEAPQPVSSPINARVLAAGGITHARSATPEFSCASFTHSKKWGVTRNPWNLDYSPGGSSGGSGATLAAGSSILATGSDIGGSIRIPASCCGVVGYKPPKGRNPVDMPFNLDFYCHTGPMGRSVADVVLLQNVMSGPDPRDPTLVPEKVTLTHSGRDLRGMRIAVSEDLGFFPVDPAVKRGFDDALDVFQSLGASIVPLTVPWDDGVIDAAMIHLRHIFGASIAPLLKTHADELTPYARAFAEGAAGTSAEDFLGALTKAGEMGQQFAAIKQNFDLFLCPTTATPSIPAAFDETTDTLEINGTQVPPMLGWVMTVPFNMLSTHPVLSVPSTSADNGVPTGIQIVGKPFEDQRVFDAAFAYEAAAPGFFSRIADDL